MAMLKLLNRFLIVGLTFLCGIGLAERRVTWAQRRSVEKTRSPRAKLPKFSKQDIEGVFYRDIFREGLVGKRPSELGRSPVVVGAPTNRGDGSARAVVSGSDAAAGGFAWSTLISAVTIEDEVKALKLKVDQEINTPPQFAGRGYQVARQRFSLLATLFAIVAEYDGQVRWKEESPAARDAFARTARNCKVGTIQVFNEAKLRKAELQDLLGGSSTMANGKADRHAQWSNVVDRSPLMKRLETAHQANLQVWTAEKSSFLKNNEKVLHESEVVAAVAEILSKEGMEDGDDETYAGYAKAMKKAAQDTSDAVKSNNYEAARKAVGAMGQACSSCHELYKG